MPLATAAGGLLAYSVRRNGAVLRKGQVMGHAELSALAEAGITEVTVALLDPGDVNEDEAARQVGAIVQSSGVLVGEPATGRVNFFAACPGLLSFDPLAIGALNAVSENVTLATLPLMSPVGVGQMVATVKIIPFAVPAAILGQALDAGRDAAVSVRPFRALSARLIQTLTADLKPSVITKTSAVTADRMARLGGSILGEALCAHDVEWLIAEIAAALVLDCDILLIAGAAAISDRCDVIPAAIEALGGRIERLGMPIDPGNLILIADIGGTPVFGLPGCAKSPVRNGLDWALERVAAGLPVTHDIIGQMGVGGLLLGLKELKDEAL